MPTDVQLQLLTHYALGELPAARLGEVERLLADDAEARAWVEQVRRTAGALSAQLAAQPGEGLGPARRAAIAARARPPLVFKRWLLVGGGIAAAAAALVAMLAMPAPTMTTAAEPPQPPVRVATVTAPAAAPASRPVVFELPPEPAFDVVSPPTPLEVLDLATAEEEKMDGPVPKGREEAVADREMGGSGMFSAIGAGGGARVPIRRRAPVEGDQAAGRYGSCGIPPQPPVQGAGGAAGEGYAPVQEGSFQDPRHSPLATFGLDVDTASYANVRRFLEQGRLPPADAVRIEELLNAFRYAAPPRAGDGPFALGAEVSACPWAPGRLLARISVATAAVAQRPPCNLVFLVDVSGSMEARNKLPLVQQALRLLAAQLRSEDCVAIVTYAESTAVALPSTPGDRRDVIIAAIDRLSAGGSTNGQAGIQLAYRTAQEHAVAGVNRVILCTDGDFNVGIASRDGLRAFISEQRRTGVTLTVFGFGMGNLKDDNLQALANSGNGTYAYIDSEDEARANLVDRLDRHLVMAAKDAKVQIEFNPARVAAWRQIGWERRRLAARDFANDAVDSGDVGVDAHVTALYELVPHGAGGEPLRYQAAPAAGELCFVKLRWKRPDLERSELYTLPVAEVASEPSADQRFASAVAAFGMSLRGSPERGSASLALAEELAAGALGDDAERRAFLELVRRARALGR